MTSFSPAPDPTSPAATALTTDFMADPIEQKTWQLAETIAVAADDRKAADISVLRVAEVSYLTDYFVLATGFSRIQVKAIADAIEQTVMEKLDRKPYRTEGQGEGSWILQDYGEVIVHIFQPEAREFYNLEAFWGHGQRMAIPQLQSQPSFNQLP